MADLSDGEKAAALDDLVMAFRDEWVDLDQSNKWVVIDGSAQVSPETVRVLRLMFSEARLERQESGTTTDQVRTTKDT